MYSLTLHIELITVFYFVGSTYFQYFSAKLGKIWYFFRTHKKIIFMVMFHLYDLLCVILLLLSLFVYKYNNFKGIKKISSLNI